MTRTNLFIAAAVAIQMAIPLGSLLSGERANGVVGWTMFARSDTVRCRVAYTDADGAPVDILDRFPEPWLRLLGKGRTSVRDAVSRRLCDDVGGPIAMRYQCFSAFADVTHLDRVADDVCEAP